MQLRGGLEQQNSLQLASRGVSLRPWRKPLQRDPILRRSFGTSKLLASKAFTDRLLRFDYNLDNGRVLGVAEHLAREPEIDRDSSRGRFAMYIRWMAK